MLLLTLTGLPPTKLTASIRERVHQKAPLEKRATVYTPGHRVRSPPQGPGSCIALMRQLPYSEKEMSSRAILKGRRKFARPDPLLRGCPARVGAAGLSDGRGFAAPETAFLPNAPLPELTRMAPSLLLFIRFVFL